MTARRTAVGGRRTSVLLAIAVMLLAGACATALEPAPGTTAVSGVGRGAVAESAGVRVIARARAWRGYPGDLRGVLTPMLVSIENGSRQPLRIRYADFTLEAPGRTFAALPPFEIAGSVSEPVGYAAVPMERFWVAPYLSAYYPWSPPFGGAFAYDPWYYDRYRPMFQRIELPTGDMVQKALPEGVVEPAGRVSGFLYFEPVRRVERIDFTAHLVDAGTGDRFGAIRIPFVVD